MRILRLALLIGVASVLFACSSKTFLKRGDAFYQSERYHMAGQMYAKAYEKAKEKEMKSLTAFKYANCLDLINDNRKAASLYRKAIRNQDTLSNAVLRLARVELENHKLEDAEENFIEYQDLKPDRDEGERGLKQLDLVKKWMEHPTRYKVTPVKQCNSAGSDFAPVYMARDTNVILFASTQKGKYKEKIDGVTGENYSNIFEVHYSNEVTRRSSKKNSKSRTYTTDSYQWSRPNMLGDTINSQWNEGAMSFSTDGNMMYFTSSKKLGRNHLGTKIYTAKKVENGWGDVMLLDIVPDSLSIGHPSISADGERLYFASDMPGGLGGNDIWYVKKEGSGWGQPVNMGRQINTPGEELFPFIREDGVLFFSSDTHMGLGGLDIFRAEKNGMGQWKVENMKYPINSTADDFGITFQFEQEKGLFASSRRKGNDDIYRFELMPVVFTYTGVVKNADTQEEMEGVVINVISSNGEQKQLISKSKGRFSLDLEPETEYIFVANQDDFLNAKDQVSTVNLNDSKAFTGELLLKPYEKPIELPNILYDFASWELREESKEALDGLVETLNDNPNITIELGSHTDWVGSVKNNQELSQKRAQSVVDYLIEKGIFWDRLQAKGYGEGAPKVVDAQLAEQYDFLNEGDELAEAYISKLDPKEQEIVNQINRRTEFKVLTTDYKPGPNSRKKPGAEASQLSNILIKDLNTIKGVFYTVQLGIFQKSNVPAVLEQFPVVFRSEADSKTYRYTFGIFDHYDEARAEAQKISRKGIKAFVIAYNNGKKITFEEAKKLKQ